MNSADRQPLLAPALQPGDTVGVVAPASNVKREALELGCAALRRMGYKPFYLESIFEQDLYFAGTAKRRLREFEQMFEAPEVKAIICARGGYGANYLLQELNTEMIARHPKILAGYSDNTTLLTYIADCTGLVVFHGPMVAKDFPDDDGVEISSWQNAVSGLQRWQVPLNPEVTGMRDGSAQGVLYGGCLSMLAASLGTPFEVKTDNKILFIEDFNAKPYQIDRMLMQMKLAGKLDDLRGIIFGEMLDCVQTPTQDYTLKEVVMRIVGDLGVPVAYGLRSGHVTRQNVTLPLGVKAELGVQGAQVRLEILEPATLSIAAAVTAPKGDQSFRA
jgi:muramoyltetrapeptide carboxypeptidase